MKLFRIYLVCLLENTTICQVAAARGGKRPKGLSKDDREFRGWFTCAKRFVFREKCYFCYIWPIQKINSISRNRIEDDHS
jgi:hypothetical protein